MSILVLYVHSGVFNIQSEDNMVQPYRRGNIMRLNNKHTYEFSSDFFWFIGGYKTSRDA